jgi:Transcription initiation factor TFIIIB, Brf1 subunit/Transcription initiation factor TFIIB
VTFWAIGGIQKMSITQTSKVQKIPQHLTESCPECTSKNLVHDTDTGETICGDCGLVLYDQMMDKGPEWRAFTQQEKASRSRVGMHFLTLLACFASPFSC